MEALTKFSTPLEWQLDRRNRIQWLLHDIYAFLERHKEFPLDTDNQWYPMGRMVAIAFSLWRSAFLTHVKRDREDIYKHTKEFLEKVVAQNAISFADDHRMCELTVDYYNGNARYRLERMYFYDDAFKQVGSLKKIYDLRKEDVEKFNQRDLWDDYYAALYDCFALFKSNWTQNVRPLRGQEPKPAAAS